MPQNNWPSMPRLPMAWGEVFDKLTILMMKSEKLQDAEKLANVTKERREIEKVVGDLSRFPAELVPLIEALKTINAELWDIEDSKRDCERLQRFDDFFVQLARRVYLNNDQRAAIKKQINELLGSALMEEKSYRQDCPGNNSNSEFSTVSHGQNPGV
jgi:vacuolar-type H+-ATPase subunit I/STV1